MRVRRFYRKRLLLNTNTKGEEDTQEQKERGAQRCLKGTPERKTEKEVCQGNRTSNLTSNYYFVQVRTRDRSTLHNKIQPDN